jgi:hypothetical protein
VLETLSNATVRSKPRLGSSLFSPNLTDFDFCLNYLKHEIRNACDKSPRQAFRGVRRSSIQAPETKRMDVASDWNQWLGPKMATGFAEVYFV